MQLFNKFNTLEITTRLRMKAGAIITAFTKSGAEVTVMSVSNLGSVIESAGTATGAMLIDRAIRLTKQGAPAAKTVSGLMTTADLLTGIITVNQGAGAASAQQLPTCANMDLAFPDAAAGDAFDFSVINTSTVAAEDATITTNTGWTLVGSIDVSSNAAVTDRSTARFRARKTGVAAWTLYRIGG